MAWVGDHMLSYAQAIVAGFTINCPESAATVLHDLKEIGPTYFFAPPAHLGKPPHQRHDPHRGRGVAEAPARPLLPRAGPGAASARRLAGQPLPLLPRLLAPLG